MIKAWLLLLAGIGLAYTGVERDISWRGRDYTVVFVDQLTYHGAHTFSTIRNKRTVEVYERVNDLRVRVPGTPTECESCMSDPFMWLKATLEKQ